MTKIGDALRRKYRNPQDALRVLGLDENLLKEESGMDNAALAKKIHAIAKRQVTVGAMVSYLKPRLAQDAKLDLAKVFDGVTGKNFRDKKPAMIALVKAQAKDKLAKDASIEDVGKVFDILEKHEVEEGTDESVSEPQHKAMEAAASGNSDLGIPKAVGQEFAQADKGKTFDAEPIKAFLREKGMSEDDITQLSGMFPKAATDEDPDEKKKREDEEAAKKKKAEDKAAADKAAKDAEVDKDKVTKTAMDEAIKLATEATTKTVRETERGIRAALVEVEPYVGKLSPALAFDSGDDVRRHALVMLNVEGAKTMHPTALAAVLKAQRPAGARSIDRGMAVDASNVSSFEKMYPDASRIGVAV